MFRLDRKSSIRLKRRSYSSCRRFIVLYKVVWLAYRRVNPSVTRLAGLLIWSLALVDSCWVWLAGCWTGVGVGAGAARMIEILDSFGGV